MKNQIAALVILAALHCPLASAEETNNGIKVGENIVATVQDNGSIILMTGGQIVQVIDKESVEQLGVAKSAVSNFLKLLEEQNIPLAEWDKKLREIAAEFKSFKKQVKNLATDSIKSEALKAQADAAIDAGKFDQAEKLFNEIRDLNIHAAKQNMLFAAEADAANGALARIRFQYVKSGEYYEHAGQALLTLGAEYENQAAEYLNWAGLGFHNGGQYPPALPLYERALGILEKVLGKDHPNVATTLNNLGVFHYHTKNYALAADYLTRALAIREAKLGSEHPHTKGTKEGLAIVLEQLKTQ